MKKHLIICCSILLIAGCWNVKKTKNKKTDKKDRESVSIIDSGVDAAGDSDPDSDFDTDTETDSDSDTRSDTEIDGGSLDCLSGEVEQPGSELCWKQCPLGQAGDPCEGYLQNITWCEATGKASDNCYPITPDIDICFNEYGPGYRLPTAIEFSDLLDETELGAGDGSPCEPGSVCFDMFGSDIGSYWSSDLASDSFAWIAYFGAGSLEQKTTSQNNPIRCIREK
jgi:hypothetical protein